MPSTSFPLKDPSKVLVGSSGSINPYYSLVIQMKKVVKVDKRIVRKNGESIVR